MFAPRATHPLVGTPLLELEQLLAEASPSLRAVLERAGGLARRRVADAHTLALMLARHEAPPFFEPSVPAPLASPWLCATDICRALLALEPGLWSRFTAIPRATLDALAQRWSGEAHEPGPALPLHPALARHLTWARTHQPLHTREHLFGCLAVEVAACVADHHEFHREGLITWPEAIYRLLLGADPPHWRPRMPKPLVELGQLERLYEAVLASTRSAPLIVVRGPAGSGRASLAEQALLALRETSTFAGWGFNLDNYHGGELDIADAPALLALSHRCIASYPADDLELATRLIRSVVQRPEDARLILRVEPSAFVELATREPALASAAVIDLPTPDLRTRVAVLLAHFVALDDWFGIDWGLPEAILLARQTAELDSLALVLACAERELVQGSLARSAELASARSNGSLVEAWVMEHARAPLVRHAQAIVDAPTWRSVTLRRSGVQARRFAREQPDDYAALRRLAASLHLRTHDPNVRDAQ